MKKQQKERRNIYNDEFYPRKVESPKKKQKSRNRNWKQRHKHDTIDSLEEEQFDE